MENNTFLLYKKARSLNLAVANKRFGENRAHPVFGDNKTERMRTMKHFEEIISIENMNLKDLVIEESLNSLIITAKKIIIVPEKKVILMD